MGDSNAREVATAPLPDSWRDVGKSGLLAAVAVARVVMLQVVDGFLEGPRSAKLAAELIHLRAELAFVRRELCLLESRFGRVEPRKRPHFEPAERLEILALRAARGWTVAERDDGSDGALLRTREAVNRFPDQVREVVALLKATFPFLGTRKTAEHLARLGLRLADTTVRRMLKDPKAPAPNSTTKTLEGARTRSMPRPTRVPATRGARVTACYTHHVWHTDFTFVPTWMGIWVPWAWFSLPQFWPFGWWVGAVVDQHSRAVLATSHWKKSPTAKQTVAMLRRAVTATGRAPRYAISDPGVQFRGAYRAWCQRSGIRPRFGAVYQHGSIAIIERFWVSVRRWKPRGPRGLSRPRRRSRRGDDAWTRPVAAADLCFREVERLSRGVLRARRSQRAHVSMVEMEARGKLRGGRARDDLDAARRGGAPSVASG